MARRPRPKLVTLTDAAAARVAEIMSDKDAGYLRGGVTNGGCAGMEYVMEFRVVVPDMYISFYFMINIYSILILKKS